MADRERDSFLLRAVADINTILGEKTFILDPQPPGRHCVKYSDQRGGVLGTFEDCVTWLLSCSIVETKRYVEDLHLESLAERAQYD